MNHTVQSTTRRNNIIMVVAIFVAVAMMTASLSSALADGPWLNEMASLKTWIFALGFGAISATIQARIYNKK